MLVLEVGGRWSPDVFVGQLAKEKVRREPRLLNRFGGWRSHPLVRTSQHVLGASSAHMGLTETPFLTPSLLGAALAWSTGQPADKWRPPVPNTDSDTSITPDLGWREKCGHGWIQVHPNWLNISIPQRLRPDTLLSNKMFTRDICIQNAQHFRPKPLHPKSSCIQKPLSYNRQLLAIQKNSSINVLFRLMPTLANPTLAKPTLTKNFDRRWPTLIDRLWPKLGWPTLAKPTVSVFWPSFSKKKKKQQDEKK